MNDQLISLFLVHFEACSRNIFSYGSGKSLSGPDCIGLQHSIPRFPLLLAILLTELRLVIPIVGKPYQYRYKNERTRSRQGGSGLVGGCVDFWVNRKEP